MIASEKYLSMRPNPTENTSHKAEQTSKSISAHSADSSEARLSPPTGERERGFGLIGHPLGHSFSARFFAEKFAAEGIDARYDNYDLADISEVEQLRHLQGFNVTIPYKQAILPYLAGISPEAQAIGAVNTVKVIDGQFYGYNTDVIGFHLSLHEWLQKQGIHPASLQALVLGTGGASRAVCYALTKLGIHWQYVSRTPSESRPSSADCCPSSADCCPLSVVFPTPTFPSISLNWEIPRSKARSAFLSSTALL